MGSGDWGAAIARVAAAMTPSDFIGSDADPHA
jgi:hypothetical protein